MDNYKTQISKLSAIEIYAYVHKIRMLWKGKTDRILRHEYPFLVWMSNNLSSAPNLDTNHVNFRISAFDESLHEQYADELEKNLFARHNTNNPNMKNSNFPKVLIKLFCIGYR